MTKKAVQDPWMINADEQQTLKKSLKGASSGIMCPKRNRTIGGECKGCDYIQTQVYMKNYPDQHPARRWAYQRKAKCTMFANIVFEADPTTVLILEIGTKLGNDILDGVDSKGWNDIAHPLAGKGRNMIVSKTKEQGKDYPSYSISPELTNCDWEIPASVLKNLPDLDNIIPMIEEDKLDDSNYMNIKSLKVGETIKFRICPPWRKANDKWLMYPVWRHWGLTLNQIQGTESISWEEDMSTVDKPKDVLDTSTEEEAQVPETPDEEQQVDEAPLKKKKVKKPVCFGEDEYYEEGESTCTSCDWYKQCGKTIAKAA